MKHTNRPKDYFTPVILVFFLAAIIRIVLCIIEMARHGAFDNVF